MSKRFINQQQYGDRKKPRLDVTISDHNFPLSQNAGPSKESNHNQQDTWGDDNDDEILLLASQACEEAYQGNNDSFLPDYSLCMQPPSTSTQMSFEPIPSTSKTQNFTFKRPAASSNILSTNLNDKCNRISSPLHGITPKAMPSMNGNINQSDDLVFNDKIYKGQDSEHMYRQILQIQEENAKLKSENGILLEKCVTKEGEASILRTQLKTCQVAVDNARLEKIKAQEKVQLEWTEKLTSATKQMQDLRTQLDFKNLEIISSKEKCKMLESTKVKLTQVTVPANDISTSHRLNSSQRVAAYNESFSQARRPRVAVSSSGVQTDGKSHFIKLHRAVRATPSRLNEILPLILQPSEDQSSLLDCSEKLQKTTELSQNTCRVFSTFHRIPSDPAVKGPTETKVAMGCVYGDVTFLAAALDGGNKAQVRDTCGHLIETFTRALTEVLVQLQRAAGRMTSAFQKEMDERYIEASSQYLCVGTDDLLSSRPLYKEEQAITARRISAILAAVLDCSRDAQLVNRLVQNNVQQGMCSDEQRSSGMELICRICSLLDSTSTAILYSGLLLSITVLIQTVWDVARSSALHTRLLDLTKTLISSRPLAEVSGQTLALVGRLAAYGPVLARLCADTGGNLKVDYDQGVLLYKKDSCHLQIFLKHIEAALKCMERQQLIGEVLRTTQDLIAFYSNVNTEMSSQNKRRCDCQHVMYNVIVYALSLSAVMLKNLTPRNDANREELESVARAGILLLYRWVLRDIEFASQLAFAEGQYHLFVELCDQMRARIVLDEVQDNMLAELLGTLQPSMEDVDMPASLHRQVWLQSFSRFTIAD